MGKSKKAPITGWSAIPSCGSEGTSAEHGAITIDSTMIKNCPIFERTLAVRLIADKGEYNVQAQQTALG